MTGSNKDLTMYQQLQLPVICHLLTPVLLSKTIEEKLTITFVTDLLASERLSAICISIKIILTMTTEICIRHVD